MMRMGGCLCEQVRFRITGAPLMTLACHCRGCQKLTSSAFSLSVIVPGDGFEVTQGEPVIGGLHGAHRQYYCPNCMSWLFTRPPEPFGTSVGVRTSLLDDPSGLEPFIEMMTAEKMPWARTSATTSFDGFPALSDFVSLMQSYGERDTAER